ncbi:MAG: segregation/condensation protein A [Deltaproteobacteria bacterium]|nr:segregation/condensation protein A [Deltaproteobacteria bacterium]MBW2137008.1 segregation/condensation protein A [Deltaproteobacteria bacterium]
MTADEVKDKDTYEVKLEIFEGPLDLLIHLIRKNELDIFDIPISLITDQYLQYLDLMKALNINLAGEFFVMASTLMHIKSRMLLPGSQEDEDEDPRTEITGPLLEYLQLKGVAGELSGRHILNRDVFTRAPAADFRDSLQAEEQVIEVNLFQLIDAFRDIVERNLPGTSIRIEPQKWSIKDKMEYVIDRLRGGKRMLFSSLFDRDKTVSELIVTFLALLELVHLGLIRVFQRETDGDIHLEGLFEEERPENG